MRDSIPAYALHQLANSAHCCLLCFR